MISFLLRFRIDPFLLLLIGTVTIASLLPVHGRTAGLASTVTQLAIALLFFLHGAKLSRAAIVSGALAWRLHLLVLAATFVLFPLLGLTVRALGTGWLDPAIASGILFLTLLPSTVQSSIAFTAMAGGNVPAAICSASASNLLGIVLTPILAAWLMGGHLAEFSGQTVLTIAEQMLLPFLVGHLSRPLTGAVIDRHKALVGRVDRSSILLVVYTAFSAAVVEGLWHRVGPGDLATILILDLVVLGAALAATRLLARVCGLGRPEEIVLLFCGSKKSLASGVPIAAAISPAAAVGPLILPLMLFHQAQLMICSLLAARYAKSGSNEDADGVATPPPVPFAIKV